MEKELRLSDQTRDRVLPPDAAARLSRWHWRLGFALAEFRLVFRQATRRLRKTEDSLTISTNDGQAVWLGCCRGSLSRGTLVVTRALWNPFRLDAAVVVRDTTCRSDSGWLKTGDELSEFEA